MEEGLAALYSETRLAMGVEVGKQLRAKAFRVAYRPTASSVIRDRGDHYDVRLTEVLRDAPPEVHLSLARDLLSRIDRRLRATRAELRPYKDWIHRPEVTKRHADLRRRRGRKRMAPAPGSVFDLDFLFERLNVDYFGGQLARPRLGWSPTRGRALYGHHDAVHDAIVINRLLDHPRVPEKVVACILHHEMLHIKHGVQRGPGGRRIVHSRAFRQDERRFAESVEAQKFLRALESGKIRLRPGRATPALPPAAPAPPRFPLLRQAAEFVQSTFLSDRW